MGQFTISMVIFTGKPTKNGWKDVIPVREWVMDQDLPGLVKVHITMERSTIFHGNIHYFNGDFQ
jgi:hypothetical protein